MTDSDSLLDTVYQRNNYVATPLTISSTGRVALPVGAVIDARNSVIQTGPTTFSLPNDNFFLGTNLPSQPNTIDSTSTRCFGAANYSCTITGGDTDSMCSCFNCRVNKVVGPIQNSALVSSSNANMTTNGPGGVRFVSFISSSGSVTTNDVGGVYVSSIMGSESCSLTNSSPSVSVIRNSIISSIVSSINALVGTPSETTMNTIMGSQASTINGGQNVSAISTLVGTSTTSLRSVLMAGSSGVLSSATNSLGTGTAPNITGFNNVLAHGATATASNQAIFGTRLDVTGGDATVTNGGVSASKGFLTPIRAITTSDTLLATDGDVYLNGTSITLTIPSAAAMGANFPLNTSRTWSISSGATFLGNVNKLSLAAGSFENNSGFTQYPFTLSGEHLTLTLNNFTPSPIWVLGNTLELEANFTAPANNFGLTPPKSDAAQLPTSTSEANHKTLTTTSYVTFTSLDNTFFWQITGGFAQAKCTFEGYFGYEIQVKNVSGGGSWLIRADLALTGSGTSYTGSYVEQGGVNTIGGTTLITGRTPRTFIDPFTPTPLSVRISQDSASLINASASITSVRLFCYFRI